MFLFVYSRNIGHWDNLEVQKQVFDYIAEVRKISNLEDWYQVEKDQITDIEGANQVLSRYDSLAR